MGKKVEEKCTSENSFKDLQQVVATVAGGAMLKDNFMDSSFIGIFKARLVKSNKIFSAEIQPKN